MPDKFRMIEKIKEFLSEVCGHSKSDTYVREVKMNEKHVIIRLEGAFDSRTIPIITKRHKGYEDTFDKHIILDFKDVGHIDCASLASLVNWFSLLKTHNRKLVIINATEKFLMYRDILKLNSVIDILSDEEEAIAYLSA